ncbi:glycosyltransferase family 4 protein [Exiguobacterium sp. s194]|uniref:glycosyltransferase family 4 protein n=1 Tax=Exiguobacterium sp. s194 TaxID=2751230 RepID=UPI001BE6DE90|nr:glycosyltransferase family 4 protein [Exiguobacterium sp. s194]
MKIAYLLNIPSPYRVDFLNVMGENNDVKVFFENKYSKYRNLNWHKFNHVNFTSEYLSETENFKFKYSYFIYLLRNNDRTFVIGGYSTFYGMLSIALMKTFNRRYILNIDGGFVKKENFLTRIIKKFFIGGATAYLVPGDKSKDYLLNYDVEESRIYKYPFTSIYQKEIVEYNQIDSLKKKYRKEFGFDENEKIIIGVGSFVPAKGYIDLINLKRKLGKEFRLVLVGGKPSQEYMDLISECGIQNIRFMDFQTKENVKKLLTLSDLFVHPSRYDVWGLVINEAMSCGLPIISSYECMAALEMIKDEHNGFLVNTQDIEQLLTKVLYILENEDVRKKMSINSIDIIQNYTIEKMAIRTGEIIGDVVIKN